MPFGARVADELLMLISGVVDDEEELDILDAFTSSVRVSLLT